LSQRSYTAYPPQVVVGIVGYYIYPFAQSRTWPLAGFTYTEVWGVISVILSILWLVPSTAYKIPWLADFVMSFGWWPAFGAVVKEINCGPFFTMSMGNGTCSNWKAVQAFCFLSAIAWLVTGLFGIQVVQARRRGGRGGGWFR